MKYLLSGLLILGLTPAHSQTWKLNIESGATLSRLLTTQGSTAKSGTLRYGYSQPGIYIAPEVQLKINEHLDAGFNYQYMSAVVGAQNRSYNAHISSYDGIDMHSFNLGLHAHRTVLKDHLKAGIFFKSGFSYNKMVMMGAGGGGGDASASPYGGPSYSYLSRSSGFEVMKGDWTPASTIGLSIGTNSKKWIADRLSFNWAATINWKNTYNNYSGYDYSISTLNGAESGKVQYQGIPFVMQFGIKYRIAGFGGKD